MVPFSFYLSDNLDNKSGGSNIVKQYRRGRLIRSIKTIPIRLSYSVFSPCDPSQSPNNTWGHIPLPTGGIDLRLLYDSFSGFLNNTDDSSLLSRTTN